jgi:hypothetical protein
MVREFLSLIEAAGTRRSNTYFRSELEVPSGSDPNQNAWLTVRLKVCLRFADVNFPWGVVEAKNKAEGLVRDSDRREYRVCNWDEPSEIEFWKRFYKDGEKFWNRRFTLLTPRDYDALDFTSAGWRVRPNVLCLFRLDPVFSEAEAHRTFKVVRLGPTFWQNFRDFWTGHGIGGVGFRSNEYLLKFQDARTLVLPHELAHATDQEHIGVMQGDSQCLKGNPSADCCYDGPNIMGDGGEVWPINSRTWTDRMSWHTDTNSAAWRIALSDNVPTRKLPLETWRRSPSMPF